MTADRARTRRRAAGLALSLAVHGALLAAFMSVTPRLATVPRLAPPAEPVVEIELRRPTAAPSAAGGPAAPARPAPAGAPAWVAIRREATPRMRTLPASVAPVAPATPAQPPAPAASAGAAGTPAPGIAAADGRWRVQGGGGDADAAARALARGTVGCGAADYLHLTADERDHCYAELLRGMRTLRPDAIPPAKRAYYDAVVAAYAKMHAPTPLSHANLGDSFGVQERWEGPPGAHPPGLACKLGFGAPRGWKTYANRRDPPHSLRLGPLPCFLTPPSGLGTEEADVPPPASLREQQDDAAHAARYAPPQ